MFNPIIKKMKHIFFIVLFGLTLFTACSSDEPNLPSADKLEQEAKFDVTFSQSLTTGMKSATYKKSEYYLFDQSRSTNGNWVYVDLRDICGWCAIAPSTIIIQEGKSYTPFKIFDSSTGPTPLGHIWNAYLYDTKQSLQLCLARNFAINDADNTLTLGNTTFTVKGLTAGSFQLEYISSYLGGESNQGGKHKEITRYKAVSHSNVSDNILAYDTDKELIKDVIDRVRAHFGDVVDLNVVYSGKVIFDNPDKEIYNLDEVAAYYGV